MNGRILYLGNNHVPPTNNDIKGEYISFGYYDAIKISENIFKENGGKFDLSKIWIQSVKDIFEMKGGYSVQAMYLFNDDTIENEKKFWDNKELPCLFLITLQLNIRDSKLPHMCESLVEDIRSYCNDKCHYYNMIIAGYFMLDENDIILAVKTDNYKLGRVITNSLHKKVSILFAEPIHISYSFTISGILKDGTKIVSEIGDIPEECQLRIVERQPGTIDNILDEMRDKINGVKAYPVFGRDDNLITFKPTSWSQILSLYSLGGPFFNDGVYRKNILSMSTLFLYSIEKNEKISFTELYPEQKKDPEDEQYKSICLALMKRIEEMYQKSIECLNDSYWDGAIQTENANYKAIWQILNSVAKFEHKAFPDYIYVAIYLPLKMLISKMVYLNELQENTKRKYITRNVVKPDEIYDLSLMNNKGIHLFLDAINQVSQNLIRAERQFMQTPKLNAGCYYVPVKLYAFYTAYVYKVVNYLNKFFGSKNSYEFMLYPGMNEQLRVKRIFYSPYDKNRLLLVEIPEKQIFNPKHMMITLCHEIGHFVGSKLRRRQSRFDHLKDAIGRTIILYIFLNRTTKKIITKDSLEYLLEKLTFEFNKEIAKEVLNVKNEWNEKHFDTILHSEYLESIFINGINSFLTICLFDENNVLEEAFITYLISNPNEIEANQIHKQKKEFLKCTKSFIYNMQSTFIKCGEKTSEVDEIVEIIFNIIKESFADLVSIMILNLSYKDYYESIFRSMSVYRIEDLIISQAMIRMAIVTETMISNNDSPLNLYWDLELMKSDYQCEVNRDMKIFLNEIILYHNRMVRDESPYSRLKDMDANSVLNVFWDKELLNILVDYLSECLITFDDHIIEEQKKILKEIKNDFNNIVSGDSMSIKVVQINKSIQNYRDCVIEKCRKELQL